MSQIVIYDGSLVPLSDVEMLTGDVGGPVGPTLGNINIIGDGASLFVEGNPGTSTLTISNLGLIETLTGNTGGAVGPDVAFDIDIVGDGDFISVTGNPGTNTLTIAPASANAVTAQTLDSLPLTAFSLDVNEGEAIFFSVKFIAAISDYSQSLGGEKWAVASRISGFSTNLSDTSGTTSKTVGVLAPTDFNFDISGNAVTFVVTGEAVTTFNWKLQISYLILDV